MLVKDMIDELGLKLLSCEEGLSKEVQGVYVCDLLSWVMSHAKKGDVWVTIQTHTNIIAVASLLELPCIIIPENSKVEKETIVKANEEHIAILSGSNNAYEICCSINELMKDR